MDFTLSTPALLFSAISLIMLAYTNRFLAIANLIRQFIMKYEEHEDENLYKQILNFKKRLMLIKYSQIFGVMSFLFCVISMFLLMLSFKFISEVLFTLSLVSMITSLLFSLHELMISVSALNLELDKMEKMH